MRRLAAGAEAAGARFLTASVRRIERVAEGVRATGAGLSLTAMTVVIAAGAHSKALAAQAGDRVPLDTERGYHVEYDMTSPLVSRPVCVASRGFYMVPMQGRLRVAGTVELGGLDAPANPKRIGLLGAGCQGHVSCARRAEPGMARLPPVDAGFGARHRAVARRQGHHPRLRHGHLGVTLAPITARMVGDIIAGRGDADWLKPYAPGEIRLTKRRRTLAYRTIIDGTRWTFPDLKDLLAKASPARSGDALAGIAAEQRRGAAGGAARARRSAPQGVPEGRSRSLTRRTR